MSSVLRELFDTLYLPLRLCGRSSKTVHQHRIVLRHFERYLNRPPTLDDLNDLTVSGLLAYLASKQKAVTANKSLEKLQAQWRFLSRRGLVSVWPEIRKLPEPQIVPLGWLEHEFTSLLSACAHQSGAIGGIPACDWWLGLHLVIYDTAERIGAVMGVKICDYDPAGRWLTVRAEVRKGKKSDKMYRLHSQTHEVLERIIARRRGAIEAPLFLWDCDESLLWTHYGKLLADAKLPTDRRSKFHRMRRTSASYFKKAGGDPTELLDHTSRTVTQRYLDPRIIDQPQASDVLPRFRPKSRNHKPKLD